jgi:hypothetical protein
VRKTAVKRLDRVTHAPLLAQVATQDRRKAVRDAASRRLREAAKAAAKA